MRCSPPGDGGELGHQLALGAVAGEAHDDHPVRLHRDHDALAEGGMGDVLAQPERRRSGARLRIAPGGYATGARLTAGGDAAAGRCGA